MTRDDKIVAGLMGFILVAEIIWLVLMVGISR
jgi:hypothetical protein